MSVAAMAGDQRAQREEVTRLGLWAFLGTVTMLFAAFTSAYIVRRSGSDWTHIALPRILWLTTGILVASSLSLELGARAGARGRWASANAGFAAALALGLGFLVGQAVAWQQLQRAGVYLPASPHRSFVYVMSGAHALHVVAAVAVLTVASARTWRGDGRLSLRAWTSSTGLCRTFWHFLLGVWVYLFLFVSLF